MSGQSASRLKTIHMVEIEASDKQLVETVRDEDEETSRLYALMNMLAHEVRNPLNALLMNLKLLAGRVSDDKNRRILQAATEQADRTNKILTDFLRYARPRKPEPSAFNILDVLNSIKTFVAPQLKEKNIELHVKTTDEPSELFTDRDMLAQILLNLILNSVEATPKGNIYIDVSKSDGSTSISVRDDGPGFLELERVFEPFYSTKDEGIGLGLAMVDSLVTALGGTVIASNARENGALVELSIPDFKER